MYIYLHIQNLPNNKAEQPTCSYLDMIIVNVSKNWSPFFSQRNTDTLSTHSCAEYLQSSNATSATFPQCNFTFIVQYFYRKQNKQKTKQNSFHLFSFWWCFFIEGGHLGGGFPSWTAVLVSLACPSQLLSWTVSICWYSHPVGFILPRLILPSSFSLQHDASFWSQWCSVRFSWWWND